MAGMNRDVANALGAALLFGASTPVAKLLVGQASPWLLAGLLYLGSGLGLTLARLLRDGGWRPSGLARGEWPWLLGAIAFGGALGPVALMAGLAHTGAAMASLLLNLEAVLTALIAWLVFRENAGRRVVLGMAAIVAGGLVLAWPQGRAVAGGASGAFGMTAIVLACLCWAIDNNLTRKVAATDALFVAASKGLIAGTVNCALAFAVAGAGDGGAARPGAGTALLIMAVGLLGYGASLVLFVLALRGLGTARTGAYFSIAPFVGALVSIALLGEPATPAFWIACALMGWGVWLHLTEHHEHLHTHEPVAHTHPHRHDEHHQHVHDFAWDGREPHSHPHRHAALTHKHPHYPDIHHQHAH